MTTPIPGHGLDPEEDDLLKEMAAHWRQVWNEAPVQAIPHIEDAANITTALQALYVAIFAFSNLRTQFASTHWFVPDWLLLLFFFTPLVCWLVSLAYAMRVFVPHVQPDVNVNEVSVSAWQKVKDAYATVAEEKLRFLHHSQRWLVGSFVLVLLAVILFALLPVPVTGPTPIIIVTPTVGAMPTP